MVCDCDEPDCKPFTVEPSQLHLFQLDTAALAEAVRAALAVKRPVRRVPDMDSVYQLGTYHPAAAASYPVYLFVEAEGALLQPALASLAHGLRKRFAALLLTRADLDPRLETALSESVFFLVLADTLELTRSGQVVLRSPLRDPLRGIHTETGPDLSEERLVEAVQTAFAIDDEKKRRAGPSMIQYLRAVAKGWSRNRIATEYSCSLAQISGLKKEFRGRTRSNPEILAGRIGDLDRVVKSVQHRLAKRIHQQSAVTGDEDSDRE